MLRQLKVCMYNINNMSSPAKIIISSILNGFIANVTSKLKKAIEEGDLEKVKELLKLATIHVNYSYGEGVTQLNHAINLLHIEGQNRLKERKEIVELLINHQKTDVNKRDIFSNASSLFNEKIYRRTPLYNAISKGNLEVVKLLLVKKNPNERHSNVDVNIVSMQNETPLYIASKNGVSSVVEQLLKHTEIDVNKPDNEGKTPLYIASRYGHLEVVEQLLNRTGIDVNKQDKEGNTPLYIASRYGHLEVVEKLLNHTSIDVNKPDNEGKTPLHIATMYGRSKIVEQLLNRTGIDVNKPDKEGNTPLYMAQAFSAEYKRSIKYIKNYEWNDTTEALEKAMIDKVKPLRQAKITANEEILELLKKDGSILSNKTGVKPSDYCVVNTTMVNTTSLKNSDKRVQSKCYDYMTDGIFNVNKDKDGMSIHPGGIGYVHGGDKHRTTKRKIDRFISSKSKKYQNRKHGSIRTKRNRV